MKCSAPIAYGWPRREKLFGSSTRVLSLTRQPARRRHRSLISTRRRNDICERQMIAGMRRQSHDPISKLELREEEVTRLQPQRLSRVENQSSRSRHLTNAVKDNIVLKQRCNRPGKALQPWPSRCWARRSRHCRRLPGDGPAHRASMSCCTRPSPPQRQPPTHRATIATQPSAYLPSYANAPLTRWRARPRPS